MSKSIFKFVLVSMVAILVIFQSCKEENPEPEVPVANFTYETNELIVTFTNTSINATSYSWDFGDSNTSTDKDPIYTYDSDGTYNVKLTAINDSQSNEQTISIEVKSKIWALVAHEGNYGAGDGSISLYDEEEMTITNNIVKESNDGSEIGSLVQSLFTYDGVIYVICNNADKIEFLSADDYTFLDNPLSDISQPRYMAVDGTNGYISCWGPWDFSNWTLPDSYIAVIDLNTKTVIDSLECGSGPEGIVVIENKLFVANNQETSVSVVNLDDKSHSKIDLDGAPSHFVVDGSGKLWVSKSTGLQAIDPGSLDLGKPVSVSNMHGKMAINGSGKLIYLLTAEPWPGTGTEVFAFDTESQTKASTALFSGENFYGIGFNPTTNKIYLSNSNAFAGPGTISLYDTDGNMLDEQTVGIGPGGFIFK